MRLLGMFARVQLVGWNKPRYLPVRRVEFNENGIEGITVDFGPKTIPRFITYRRGSGEWAEAMKGVAWRVKDDAGNVRWLGAGEGEATESQ